MRRFVKGIVALALVAIVAAAGVWALAQRDGELVSSWIERGHREVTSWVEYGRGEVMSWLGISEDQPPAPASAPAAPPPTPVETVKAETGTVSEDITVAGTLRANESVGISVEVAGLIRAIEFKEGEPIEAGKLLFELDDSIWRAELAQAEARLGLSERNHKRIAELFEKGVATARERDEALAELETARAAVGLAQARLEKATIKAPFSGIIGLRSVSVGEFVSPGQTLVNLENFEPIKVDFHVSERFLPELEEGQSIQVAVESLPERTFDGVVIAIDPKVDPETRSVTVRAEVPNQERLLRPGQFARVTVLIARRDDAVLIPEQSLMPRGSDYFVFKVVEGKAQMVEVEVGARRTGQVEIVSGLAAGDLVVTAGHQKIRDGAPVQSVSGEKVS